MIAAAFRTPELQRAQFGDAALERDRHDLAVAASNARFAAIAIDGVSEFENRYGRDRCRR